MSSKALCDLGWFLANYRTEVLADDFFAYTSGNLWTTATTNSGTIAADDTAGTSKLLLTSGTTATNFTIVKSTNQPFLQAAGHPMYMATQLNYTSQATNNAVIVAGFSSTTTLTQTSGGAPTASYSGALIFKTGASDTNNAVWSCQSSNGATKTTSVSSAPATDGTYHLRIDCNDFDSANCEIAYFVNGVQLRDSTTGLPIKHKLAYSGLVKQCVIAGTAAGSANAQTAYVDYLAGGQLRNGL